MNDLVQGQTNIHMSAYDRLPDAPEMRRVAVRLEKKALFPLRNGHPWVFEDSVSSVSYEAEPGAVAVLFDTDRKPVGTGLYDPFSPVRVKVLGHGANTLPASLELFRKKVAEAKARREGGIPQDTDGWRIFNGESDGMPGLVADKYASAVCLKVYSPAWIPHLKEVAQALFEEYKCLDRLAVRTSREVADLPEKYRFGLTDGVLFGPEDWDGKMLFREYGLIFEADLLNGQKTGFFLDQRENRHHVAGFCKGQDVLNVFSYSGGFSVHAAAGGAVSVASVDVSRYALDTCVRNFSYNSSVPAVAACRHEEIAEDAFKVLEDMGEAKRKFGVVIVDPPSFAKSSGEKARALKAYSRLAKLASRLVKDGGVLAFASCSSRVDADSLFETIETELRHNNLKFTEICRKFHQPDHPAEFKESSYLKCIFLRIRGK